MIRVFLCGDVMTGRGIDQILENPSDPKLHENYVQSALDYVQLAERKNGPISRRVAPEYIWGDALDVINQFSPDLRIINLETAITTHSKYLPKGINYRMHPKNTPLLKAAKIDCAVIANNHVLDWGKNGLIETLDSLRNFSIQSSGAGSHISAAQKPAVFDFTSRARALIFAYATESSGVPKEWSATRDRAGVAYLDHLNAETVAEISNKIALNRRPCDLVIVSLHWGGNWGYEIPSEHRAFAHALIDAAQVDVIHGHSSHHPLGIEIYKNKLILYGCGDLISDYEGISGYDQFRSDLGVLYFADLDEHSGALLNLTLVPMQTRQFRLSRPSAQDFDFVTRTLARESLKLGSHVEESHSYGLRSLVVH